MLDECLLTMQALHRAPPPAHLKHLPAYLKDAGTEAVQQDSQRKGDSRLHTRAVRTCTSYVHGNYTQQHIPRSLT